MKKILSMILCVAMMATLIAGSIVTVSAEVTEAVDGTIANVTKDTDTAAATYTVKTPAGFLHFQDLLGKGQTFEGATIQLTADLDMSSETVTTVSAGFAGTFDGQGHTVSGIEVTNAAGQSGLFGKIIEDTSATVKNLAIVDSKISTSNTQVGSIFGNCYKANGNLLNLYIDVDIAYTGTLTAATGVHLGGLVGFHDGNTGALTFESCVYAGDFTTTSTNAKVAGGLVGTTKWAVNITDCAFYGSSDQNFNANVGGFIGNSTHNNNNTATNGTIQNSIVYGSLGIGNSGWKGAFSGGALYNAGARQGLDLKNVIYDSTQNAQYRATGAANEQNIVADEIKNISASSMIGFAAELPEGFSNWTVTTAGYPMPKKLVQLGFVPEIAKADAVTTLVGYQATAPNNNKFNLRLVSVIDIVGDVEALTDYDQVGFRVVASYADGTTVKVLTKDYSTTTVYKAITGNEGDTNNEATNYTADALGGDAIFVLACENIPANKGKITFDVTTYYVKGKATVDGATEVFQIDPTSNIPQYDGLENSAEELWKEYGLPEYSTSAELTGIYQANEGNYSIYYTGTTQNEVTAYEEQLEAAGFVLYTENTIGNNAFATYTKGEVAVRVAWYPTKTACRIVYGPKGYLPSTTEPTYTAVVTPTLAQLERSVPLSEAQGLSFVTQLADGSYLIVDGGPDRGNDKDTLYNYLVDNKPASHAKPRVTWMITHAHSDHMSLAIAFLSKYSDQIDLETVCYNFPDFGYIEVEKESVESSSGYETRFKDVISSKYPNTKTYIFHTGDKLLLPGCEIEFLVTHEDFWVEEFRYINDSSAAWKMTIQGKSLLVLGDCTTEECNWLADVYGNALKSDILQVTHHGHVGGTVKLYQLVAPSICLWPAHEEFLSDTTVNEYANKDFNKYLYNNVDRHYTISEDTILVYPDLTLKED